MKVIGAIADRMGLPRTISIRDVERERQRQLRALAERLEEGAPPEAA